MTGSGVSGGNLNNNNNPEMVKRGSDDGGVFGVGRGMSDIWEQHSHMQGMGAMFPGNMATPRGGGHRGMVGMIEMPRGVGVPPPMSRPPMVPGGGRGNSIALKPTTEEDELKDLENMLNKISFREMQKSKTGEELLDLIHRPTAKETAVAARVFGSGVCISRLKSTVSVPVCCGCR